MSDLISRADAIDAIEEYMQDSYIRDADIICSDLQHEINILPSTEPKTGHWAPKFADVPNECSECGEYWDKYVYGQEIWYTGEVPNFCPNCGADMRGGEQSG